MFKILNIGLFFFAFLFFQCSIGEHAATQQPAIAVDAYAPTYPLLVEKEYNPVFRINIPSTAAQELLLQSISASIEGTIDLKQVDKATIFYTGSNDEFSTAYPFAEISSPLNHTFTLQGEQVLQAGNNYLWLSLTLDASTPIDQTLEGALTGAEVNKAMVSFPQATPTSPIRLGHALRQHQEDGVNTYRIPGLVTTNDGTLIAVYDIRRNSSVDLQEDIDIGMSRSTDGGLSWDPMQVIMDMGTWGGRPEKENGVGDPSILVDRNTGTIWVAALWLHGKPDRRAWFASQPGMTPQETGQFLLTKSTDDGQSWSAPINITEQIKHPGWHLLLDGPGKGITMEDGTLVFPAQFKDEDQVPHATIIYSKDQGETWTIGSGAKSHTTEAQVVELADHSLMLNMRDDRGSGPGGRNGTGARSVAISTDLGKTWTEHPTSRQALPEPVCMASLIKHHYDGADFLLFSNPADQYVRKNMTIKLSSDEGMNWNEDHFLLLDEGTGRGYSCLTSIDEQTIGILYEGSQADLIFQRIKIAELF